MAAHAKIVRDSVYGYIELFPDELEFVDTAGFQRLRRIKQLTATYLYPNANHSRFEHSLGVMKLGRDVWRALKDQKWLDNEGIPSDEATYNTLRYACLLHDVGHTPLSHLGEAFVDKNAVAHDLTKELAVHGITSLDGAALKEAGKPHELLSCLFALRHFAVELKKNAVDLELFCRMILGLRGSPTKKTDPLTLILNSPHDVDRLDYVLRDSETTALMGVSVDYARILMNVAMNKRKLVFRKPAVSTVVNLVHGRDHLFYHLYNHHTCVYTDHLTSELMRIIFDGRENVADYFSVDAIVSGLRDDIDVWGLLKKYQRDPACAPLADRLFGRRHHKPLWKDPHDFGKKIPDKSVRNTIAVSARLAADKKLPHEENAIVKHIQDQTGKSFAATELLVVSRSVARFSPNENREVYFLYGGHGEANTAFSELYYPSIDRATEDVVPYVFYDEAKTSEEELLGALAAFH